MRLNLQDLFNYHICYDQLLCNLFPGKMKDQITRNYLGKHTDKVEHGEIGTCARIEISQDADNADQKVKWSLQVDKP